MNTAPTKTEIAWLDGFWEGEGSIYAGEKRIVLSVSQLDTFTLNRCRAILDCGAVVGPYKNKNKSVKHKLMYTFLVCNFEYAQAIVAIIWTHLSPARKHQIRGALQKFIKGCEARKAKNSKCKRGHERTPENTLFHKNGHKQCKVCVNALQVERYHKKYKFQKKKKKKTVKGNKK